jgi:tRNA pseudouridine55 synthase
MQARAPRRPLDGLLLLDKPGGCTSNAALQRVKWLFRARKAGHTGSLDPLATGMLPICLGEVTKLSPYLLGADKTYRVTLALGARTTTGDADGEAVEWSPVTALERSAIEAVIPRFIGEISQVPPMYSALKQGGRRLYELARAGVEVERQPRLVNIHEIVLESDDPVHPVLRVRCSKGSYIRTLVEDLASAAGTLAHVAALRRLSVEPYPESAMRSMEELEELAAQGEAALDDTLLTPDQALPHWPRLRLGAAESLYLRQGNTIMPGAIATGLDPGPVRLGDHQGRFLGVGELLADGRLAPRRIFAWNIEKNQEQAVTPASGRVE